MAFSFAGHDAQQDRARDREDSGGRDDGDEAADGCIDTEALVAFVEGRIDDAMRAQIERHASRCASCRTVLSSLGRDGTPTQRATPGAIAVEHMVEPGARIARYVINRRVGAGGMGVVYAAHDPELDRVVAVKLLRGDCDRGMHERLRREAQAMAQLTHPNVVAVYDVGRFNGDLFIAMEYVAGQTLARWIATPRSIGEILAVYRAAGAGLAAAHVAGIVHRDFKPDNVLIGSDGRVCVGDFGLARTAGAVVGRRGSAAIPIDLAAHGTPSDLTAPGTLLGTPSYLAPELYLGADADARSDQFSFCVALFTALYGVRPFVGETLDELAHNVLAGRAHIPADARGVPRRIRAAIQRGLAVDPDARFDSLDDLLAELAPRPRRLARWGLGLGAALIVGFGVTAWRAELAAERPDQRCTGAAAAFATAWNPVRRGAVALAVTATQAPLAATTLHQVTDALDRYANRWTAAHTAACRATRILGEQSEASLDLRMACLERRRQDAAALVDALVGADADVVAHAAQAARGLVDAGACSDLAALHEIIAPPSDPSARARLAELTPRLAAARAKYELGAPARALELVGPLAADARALAYRPFEAEVDQVLAEAVFATGDPAGAEAALEAAVWAAEAGRHDEVAARAWAYLIYVVGYGRGDPARAAALIPRATAALARIGGNLEIEASLERALGIIDASEHRIDPALAHLRRSVVLAERARPLLGSAPPLATLDDLARALRDEGHADEAAALDHATPRDPPSAGRDHHGANPRP